MAFLRILLFPISLLYDAITRVRNYLYDIGHKKSFRFDVMVVSVGNLTVGGSGKTPMTEYLIRLLRPHYRLATLSRGYGRTTRGLRFATGSDSAATLGDEPYQFYLKFGDEVGVTVGEDRAFAIPNMLQQDPVPAVIVLDDAFQHRSVNPQFSILVTDYYRPFYSDWVLPMGNLRESRRGAKRSDAIVITKCVAGLSEGECKTIEDSVHRYAPGKPVFFSSLEYEEPVSFGSGMPLTPDVVLVSGIANSKALEDYVRSKFNLVRHFQFRDHHHYTAEDLEAIDSFRRSQAIPVSLLTTEKDRVRLIDPSLRGKTVAMPWWCIPIRVAFSKNGSEFDSLVLHAIRAHELDTTP